MSASKTLEVIMQRTLPFSPPCCLQLAVAPRVLAQAPTGTEARIRSTMRSAPPSFADAATVMDWPAEAGGEVARYPLRSHHGPDAQIRARGGTANHHTKQKSAYIP